MNVFNKIEKYIEELKQYKPFEYVTGKEMSIKIEEMINEIKTSVSPKFLNVKSLMNPDTNKQLEYVDKKRCVVVFVMDNEIENALFVKQYRAGSKSHIYESVAGVVEDYQTPFEAMLAELSQEVGIHEEDISNYENLGDFYSSVGWTNEIATLYSVILKKDFTHHHQELDDGESLTYEWVNLKNIDKLWDGPIPIKTALALNYITKLIMDKRFSIKKLCIFGGSFNPVTNLHMSMAERVIDELGIDKFIFEPVGDKYEKDSIISAKDRYNMLLDAVDYSENEHLAVGNFEMNEIVQPTTFKTLMHYKELYPNYKIYFMVGSDNLKLISKWADNNELLSNFNIVCIQREGDENIYQEIILNDPYLSKYSKNIHIIYENATNNISSTKVRSLVKANKSINWLVPKPVKNYIQTNNLYK